MGRMGLYLLIVLGTAFPVIQPLQAKGSSPSPKTTSASDSFGIQKFQTRKEPPPFTLKDLNGNQISLNAYKGKPLLLFFWASWCLACKEDIALLEKFFEMNKGQIEFLTIAIDGEEEQRVRRVVKKYRIVPPVLLDMKEKTARAYGVRMVPTTFLINWEGLMKGMIVGQRDWCAPNALPAIKELLDFR